MKRTSRIVVAIAALSLGTLFVAPMWRVDLKAPQYPEGLGLRIWINQIRGATPNGLNSINGLNHYIGMKAIEPDQIPELRFMPYVVIGLMLGGLLVAGLGKRGLLYAYLGVFFAIAMAGLYDFWRWEYDYGHNLDPTAAIRITGMSYQPPLIGGKQLLNFHATSWPDVGGWAAIVAVSLVVVAALIEWRAGRSASRPLPAAAAARGLAGGMLA
jgi:copper chaperone NosL